MVWLLLTVIWKLLLDANIFIFTMLKKIYIDWLNKIILFTWLKNSYLLKEIQTYSS